MSDGWSKTLDCPVCGEPCATMPPYRPNSEYPHPWWQDGDSGVCQCGAELTVDADGELAHLVADEPEATGGEGKGET